MHIYELRAQPHLLSTCSSEGGSCLVQRFLPFVVSCGAGMFHPRTTPQYTHLHVHPPHPPPPDLSFSTPVKRTAPSALSVASWGLALKALGRSLESAGPGRSLFWVWLRDRGLSLGLKWGLKWLRSKLGFVGLFRALLQSMILGERQPPHASPSLALC